MKGFIRGTQEEEEVTQFDGDQNTAAGGEEVKQRADWIKGRLVGCLAPWTRSSSSETPSACMQPWPQAEVLVTSWQRMWWLEEEWRSDCVDDLQPNIPLNEGWGYGYPKWGYSLQNKTEGGLTEYIQHAQIQNSEFTIEYYTVSVGNYIHVEAIKKIWHTWLQHTQLRCFCLSQLILDQGTKKNLV